MATGVGATMGVLVAQQEEFEDVAQERITVAFESVDSLSRSRSGSGRSVGR